jgi:hypothetical protein
VRWMGNGSAKQTEPSPFPLPEYRERVQKSHEVPLRLRHRVYVEFCEGPPNAAGARTAAETCGVGFEFVAAVGQGVADLA